MRTFFVLLGDNDFGNELSELAEHLISNYPRGLPENCRIADALYGFYQVGCAMRGRDPDQRIQEYLSKSVRVQTRVDGPVDHGGGSIWVDLEHHTYTRV